MHVTASRIEDIHSDLADLAAEEELCAMEMPVAVAAAAVVETAVGSALRCYQTKPSRAAAAATAVVVIVQAQWRFAVGSDSDSAGEGFAARPVRMGCSRD